MSFELTKDSLAEIQDALHAGANEQVLAFLEELHPADMAEVIDELSLADARHVYGLLDHEVAAEVLLELDDDLREKILDGLSSKEIAENVIEHIDSDDAADVMSELTDEKKLEVISHLDDVIHAGDIVDLMRYEEGTAGALMAKEMIRVRSDWSVKRAIIEMRKQAENVDDVYSIYVVDKDDHLVGTLGLTDLLFSAESTRTLIKHLCDEEVEVANADDDVEDVVQQMKKYDLAVIPVVDEQNKLVGRITFDDVMDVMEEEAEKDYQMASGITENVDSDDSVLRLTRARLPWLIIGLMGGVLVAQVISLYEEQLRIDPKLAFFIPLIAAMGGNVGVQSSAIVVQGLANQSIQLTGIGGKLMKELSVALINASVCAALMLGFNLLTGNGQALSFTVSIALFSVIIFASILGTLTPLVLDRFKIDPALATGPFITTMNDIMGLFVYFIVGRMLYAAHFGI